MCQHCDSSQVSNTHAPLLSKFQTFGTPFHLQFGIKRLKAATMIFCFETFIPLPHQTKALVNCLKFAQPKVSKIKGHITQ